MFLTYYLFYQPLKPKVNIRFFFLSIAPNENTISADRVAMVRVNDVVKIINTMPARGGSDCLPSDRLFVFFFLFLNSYILNDAYRIIIIIIALRAHTYS